MKSGVVTALVLFLNTMVFAEPLAIFGRHETRLVDSDPEPGSPGQAAFFEDYRGDRDGAAPFEAELPLSNPPAWGKTVSDETGGAIYYHRQFPRGFVCKVELHDLIPDHAYILTLNGNPQKDGNDLLPTPVPGNKRERYYDFLDIKTDVQGSYDGNLGVFLKPGAYDVRFYVKDAADFKIVLYRDFFRFTVN